MLLRIALCVNNWNSWNSQQPEANSENEHKHDPGERHVNERANPWAKQLAQDLERFVVSDAGRDLKEKLDGAR